jgi:hypothetical protein
VRDVTDDHPGSRRVRTVELREPGGQGLITPVRIRRAVDVPEQEIERDDRGRLERDRRVDLLGAVADRIAEQERICLALDHRCLRRLNERIPERRSAEPGGDAGPHDRDPLDRQRRTRRDRHRGLRGAMAGRQPHEDSELGHPTSNYIQVVILALRGHVTSAS